MSEYGFMVNLVCLFLDISANIVRRDMLKTKTAFSGSFDTYCQEDSVPPTLTGLVGMVLNGSNIREQPNHLCIPALTLAISQLLVFNFSARRRGSTKYPIKHSHHQETRVCVPGFDHAHEDTQ